MRRAWLSLAAGFLLTACGSQAVTSVTVQGTVSALGLQMTLESAAVRYHPLPYLQGPLSSRCVEYTIQVRSTDGRRHELRPGGFWAGYDTPADAIGRCGGPQLEPTWIGSSWQIVVVTILEYSDSPLPLTWRVRS